VYLDADGVQPMYVLKGCGFCAEFSVYISAGFFNLLEHALTAYDPLLICEIL